MTDSPGPFSTFCAIAHHTQDEDPFDIYTESPGLGLLLRTDYTNESAWQAFLAKLQESEKEFAAAATDAEGGAPSSSAGVGGAPDQPNESDDIEMQDGAEDDEEDEEEEMGPIFSIVNPGTLHEREALTNLSNLAALRLLNDVDIRPAPPLPVGSKRISPPHRLVDHASWQEVYTGKPIWIYDTQSNSDQCVRVVSSRGDVYGTATGDSWRARVSHICELQVNIAAGMRINFGGLDRWDFAERQRNMEEATAPIV